MKDTWKEISPHYPQVGNTTVDLWFIKGWTKGWITASFANTLICKHGRQQLILGLQACLKCLIRTTMIQYPYKGPGGLDHQVAYQEGIRCGIDDHSLRNVML
jgi:hypothetical protein